MRAPVMLVRALMTVSVVCWSCVPAPVVLPPDGPGTCETARENLAKLGGCGMDLGTFVKDCQSESDAEAEIGVRLPVGCLSAAKNCAEAQACE